MNEDYIQCKLTKDNRSKTFWIPREFAVKGKYLRIKDINKDKDILNFGKEIIERLDLWEDGWYVEGVFENAKGYANHLDNYSILDSCLF